MSPSSVEESTDFSAGSIFMDPTAEMQNEWLGVDAGEVEEDLGEYHPSAPREYPNPNNPTKERGFSERAMAAIAKVTPSCNL